MNNSLPTDYMIDILLDDLERVDLNKKTTQFKEDVEVSSIQSSEALYETIDITTDDADLGVNKPIFGNLIKSITSKTSPEAIRKSEEKLIEPPPNTPNLNSASSDSNLKVGPISIVNPTDGFLDVPANSPSKTRLFNLPPKDKDEEKKHLIEFQKMMELASKKEAIKKQHEFEMKQKHEKEQHQRKNLWQNDFIPNFDKSSTRGKMIADIRDGIPVACRGTVWYLCIKPHLKDHPTTAQIDSESYQFLIKRFDTPTEAYQQTTTRNLRRIELDIKTTFPELKLFNFKTSPYYYPLLNLLKAHSGLNPNEPYNYGLGHIGATLLLNMDEDKAFQSLQYLLLKPILRAFLLGSDKAVSFVTEFNQVFETKLPKLYSHFKSIKLRTEMFLNAWLENYYTVHLSLEISSLIWDHLILRPDLEEEILLNIGILILVHREIHLYGRLDETLTYLGPGIELDIKEVVQTLNTVGKNSKKNGLDKPIRFFGFLK